ncbi:hypothetical protein GCM10027026_45040 [Myroides odoratimimus subsp. xuanwuensis]
MRRTAATPDDTPPEATRPDESRPDESRSAPPASGKAPASGKTPTGGTTGKRAAVLDKDTTPTRVLKRPTVESSRQARHFTGLRHPRLALVHAAHPRQALITALGLAVAAALSGRPSEEVGLVLLTVLVGQVVLGWHNDIVDRVRDRESDAPLKPVAQEQIDPGSVWFAIACGLLVVIPLAVGNGVTAGSYYLMALAIGLAANIVLRRSVLSWVPWAASFALYPAFLSYGGWGGQTTGSPPEPLLVVLTALLGVGVHFLRALPGLVSDNRAGMRHLPLRIALRTGAPKLLWLSIAWTALVLVALAWAGLTVGLAR